MPCLSFLQRKQGHKAVALTIAELKFHMSIRWTDLIYLLEGLACEWRWECLFAHSWEGRREVPEIPILLDRCLFGEYSSLETLPEPRKHVFSSYVCHGDLEKWSVTPFQPPNACLSWRPALGHPSLGTWADYCYLGKQHPAVGPARIRDCPSLLPCVCTSAKIRASFPLASWGHTWT